MAQNNETRNYYPIPVNYQSGITLFGHNYKGRNITEAVIFTGMFMLLTFFLSYFVIRLNAQFTTYAVFGVALISFPLFTKGVNGASVTKQLSYVIKSYFRRRVTLYNNKVKRNATPYITAVIDSQKALPRDKINELFNKYKKKMSISNTTKIDEYSLEEEEYIFIDDEEQEQKESLLDKWKGGIISIFKREKKINE